MRRRRTLIASICAGIPVAVLLVILLRPKPEILFDVISLPTPGIAYAWPRAINDQGQVVGVATVPHASWGNLLWPELTPLRQPLQEVPVNLWHIFLWDKDGGMRDLGPAADLRHFEYVLINNAGQVAATGADPNGNARAFLQDPNGTRHDLHAPDSTTVYIRGLNNRGQVVGYSERERAPRQAFLWDRTRGMQSLAPSGTIESLATGINDAGQVVGFASLDRSNQWRAFLRDPNGGVQDLGVSPFGQFCTCQINNLGFVLGQFGSPVETACLSTWTRETGARRLRSPRGTLSQTPRLNDASQFLVCVDQARFRAKVLASLPHVESYLYDPNGRAKDIASCVNRADVFEFLATGINSQGQITGLLSSKDHPGPQGVVLVPIKK